MRGVVALAAAIALPVTLADGSEFPQRNLIVFLTFSVIFVTLVLQGLTLPPLIRALGLTGAPGNKNEEEDARRIITSVALAHLEEIRGKDEPGFEAVYDDVAHHYSQRLAILNQDGAGGDAMSLKELEPVSRGDGRADARRTENGGALAERRAHRRRSAAKNRARAGSERDAAGAELVGNRCGAPVARGRRREPGKTRTVTRG